MSALPTCAQCGTALPAGTPPWLCPKCLLAHAAAVDASEGPAPAEAPPAAPTPSTPLGDALPYRLGGYELLERIGQGGMGVVYKARQRSLDRCVAVKVLSLAALGSPETVHRFRTEAVTAGSLQHPNIVAVHEVGLAEGQHYLVMDYVPGPTLADLTKHGPLPARQAAQYLRTIAEAVHFAHERGILHRDLKPSNVLIDANNQPRVTDFGLAKRLASSSSTLNSQLTLSGQVLGSPAFIPPEQASGQRGRIGRRSDVYALGAILYHLLTGRPPFVGEALADTLRQVLNDEPVEPRLLNPAVPRDLDTICAKCLEKEPERRYPTAQAFAEELGRFLESRPILARPPGLTGKVWRWSRRQPVRAGLIAAVVLVSGLGLSGVLWQWRQARRNAEAELQQRQLAEAQSRRGEAEAVLARRNAYAADMKEVQRALDDNDLGRALELLNRHRPVGKAETRKQKAEIDLRGWEWRYLWARCRSEERFTLCQYSNAVTALAFSADAKWLAVRRNDDAVAVWDAVSRRSVAELSGAGYYKALAFAPQGNLLAWGNEDATGKPVVSFWDVSARKETARFSLPDDLVSVAFSPDAKAIATLAHNGAVQIRDVESGTVLTHFTTATVNVRAELRSGAAGAKAPSSATDTVGRRQSESQPVESRSSEFHAYFGGHYGLVLFSPDCRWLAVGEVKPRIRLLDRITGKETVIPVPVPRGGITALAFSPDSKQLAAGCGFEDHQVYVWDLAARTAERLAGHSGCIVGLAFSPDGQTLASVSVDQTVRLWDVAGKAQPRRFQGHTEEVWAVAWSPSDGRDLVTGGKDGSVRYWDPAADPAPLHAVLDNPAWFWGPAFFPDSKSLLTVTRPRGSVVRWSVEREANTLRRVDELSWVGTNHTSVDLSSDGRWLALGDYVGNIQVWDYPGRRFVTNLVSPGRWIFGLMFSPSSKILGCGTALSNSLAPALYAVDGWRELDLRGVNVENLFEADLSPDGRTLAIAYTDGTVVWWDLATGQRETLFQFHHAADRIQVAFSRDGSVFAAGSLDGQIRVWDVVTRRVRPIAHGRRNGLTDLAFSHDGRRLVAAGTNPNDLIRIWDVETGRELATLPGEPGLLCHSGFSPDGNTLFATSFEGITQLWRAPSWEEIDAAENRQKGP